MCVCGGGGGGFKTVGGGGQVEFYPYEKGAVLAMLKGGTRGWKAAETFY